MEKTTKSKQKYMKRNLMTECPSYHIIINVKLCKFRKIQQNKKKWKAFIYLFIEITLFSSLLLLLFFC